MLTDKLLKVVNGEVTLLLSVDLIVQVADIEFSGSFVQSGPQVLMSLFHVVVRLESAHQLVVSLSVEVDLVGSSVRGNPGGQLLRMLSGLGQEHVGEFREVELAVVVFVVATEDQVAVIQSVALGTWKFDEFGKGSNEVSHIQLSLLVQVKQTEGING